MRLSEVPRDKRIAVMGDSGTGKTWLLGTFAKIAPTVIVTADPNGLDTLAKLPDIDPEVVLIRDWSNPWEHYETLKELAATHSVLALDDFGAMQRLITESVAAEPRTSAERNLRRASPERLATEVLRSSIQGKRRLLLQHYGNLSVATNAWLHAMLELPYAVKIVTLLAEVREHPRTGEDCLFPSLQGAIRYDLLARFSLTLNTFEASYNNTTYWCATSKPHPRIPTKDRYAEPRTWVNPTGERLWAHVNNGKEEPETSLERTIGVGI